MRRLVVTAGAVLALAVMGWWSLRAQERGGGVVLVAGGAPWPRQIASSPADAASVAMPGEKHWVQSEADKAWCRLLENSTLPTISNSAPEPLSPKDYRKALAAASPVWRQFQDEEDRLAANWIKRLRARGDERSVAAADMLEDSDTATRHLIDQARNSHDPVVYAWALNVCAKRLDCELTPQRWAQLDPHNLPPWIWEAERARRNGDTQAQREALYQIGQSTRNENYVRELQQLLLKLSEARAPGLQMEAEGSLNVRVAFANMPSVRGVSDYCNEDLETDSSRHGICLAAGETLWRFEDDTVYARMALSLTRKHVPDNDPLWSARRKEFEELQALGSKQFERELDKATESEGPCAMVAVINKQLQTLSALGELAYLRKLRDTPPQ